MVLGVISCCLGALVLVLVLDHHGEAMVLIPCHYQYLPSSTRPTQPASRCLQRWECMVGQHFLFQGCLSMSVMWCIYGICWVLTEQVSPSWGLPVSLCTFLACVNSLTSHLNREGGWVVVGMHHVFIIIVGCHW